MDTGHKSARKCFLLTLECIWLWRTLKRISYRTANSRDNVIQDCWKNFVSLWLAQILALLFVHSKKPVLFSMTQGKVCIGAVANIGHRPRPNFHIKWSFKQKIVNSFNYPLWVGFIIFVTLAHTKTEKSALCKNDNICWNDSLNPRLPPFLFFQCPTEIESLVACLLGPPLFLVPDEWPRLNL